MCKFEGYYDGPPIIPPRLKEMTIRGIGYRDREINEGRVLWHKKTRRVDITI